MQLFLFFKGLVEGGVIMIRLTLGKSDILKKVKFLPVVTYCIDEPVMICSGTFTEKTELCGIAKQSEKSGE